MYDSGIPSSRPNKKVELDKNAYYSDITPSLHCVRAEITFTSGTVKPAEITFNREDMMFYNPTIDISEEIWGRYGGFIGALYSRAMDDKVVKRYNKKA